MMAEIGSLLKSLRANIVYELQLRNFEKINKKSKRKNGKNSNQSKDPILGNLADDFAHHHHQPAS